MQNLRRLAVLPIAMLILAACQSGTSGESGDPTAEPSASHDMESMAPSDGGGANISNLVCVGEATTYLDWLEGDLELAEADPIEEPADSDDDLLDTIMERGEIVVSTDPNYAPQSFLEPDGSFVGFDIDVATEIANRLGVDIRFETPEWDAITAGSWSERWDISVGSMTITEDRKGILSFTQPYYYTPAQVAVSERSGITSLEDLPFDLPEGAEATTLPTDANCAESIQAGRSEFDVWISSSTTVEGAIEAGSPVIAVGDPVFGEPLAVAIDKSGPPHDELLYEIDRIIGEMHEDGTLTSLSEEWFDGLDLTKVADAN
ncbi:MAG: transporter substrate-binding domain-containing protein [Chloroflexi bacterium]|nr:transporter substrate-binding domain-containing protein [Chloroflexota bacterium]